MTVYICKRAKWKLNIGVYYEDARNFLLCILAGLGVIAIGLIAACLYLNSQFTRIDIEAGDRLYASDILGEGAEFGEDFDPDLVNHAGVYYFSVVNGGISETVRLSVTDTKAPEIVVKDIFFAVNRATDGDVYYPSPEDFIESVYEPDCFTGEFLSELPDMKKLGEHEMQVRFTDASGNKTEIFTVKMTQITDNEPPYVDASELIVCEVGGAIEYKPYVSLSDNCIGELSFEVDESGLDLGEVGEYDVFVVGRDRVGNKSERIKITVRVVESYSEDKLDELLCELIDGISPEGKDREELCREIYKSVRRAIAYTGDSQKGDVERAAYYALIGGGGDCYSYFSVTKLLLDRCGIPNLDVERAFGAGDGTHFWNIVNIGGEEGDRWYHLDSTELRVDRYEHSGCLLTEKQIDAYSKARRDFYLYDKSGYPTISEEIITPTPRLEEFY